MSAFRIGCKCKWALRVFSSGLAWIINCLLTSTISKGETEKFLGPRSRPKSHMTTSLLTGILFDDESEWVTADYPR